MARIDLINIFIKIFLITLFIYLIYEKITNYKNNSINYIFVVVVSVIVSIMYIIVKGFLPTLIPIIILYIIYGIIINKAIKKEFNYVAYIFSCVIAYAMYLISIATSGIILLLIIKKREYANPINLITISIIYVLLFLFVFTRKRFKKGFNFLKSEESNKYVKKYAIFWVGVIVIILGMFQNRNNFLWRSCVATGSVCIMLSITIWIKSQITKTYKNRMRDRTIEMQKIEIDEQARIMEELKSENLKLASAIHKYNKKFSSLEFAMKNVIEKGIKTEFANEISVILEETKDASQNFAKEVETKSNKIPLTNNVGIDNMFKYMQEEARKKEINFDLKLNTSINSLLESIITKDKFETLIGDHLKDAIIAIDASSNSYKSILVTLGLIDGNYEFTIYDTGIEFEIDTLLKLGQEQVTTHKEEGGTGIGFITTFETLKECKASLIIEEYNPEATNYTKAVIIRFDGKNEYRICSYRAEKIKEKNHGRKIHIRKIK